MVELGAGTGANLEHFGDEGIKQFTKIHLVDLTPSLMDVAKKKISDNHWDNVETHLADAITFKLDAPVDIVLFSYSLTMIPNWFAAIDNAFKILKPGGQIAVVDYYVSRRYPPKNHTRHSWLCRTFGPNMFSKNGVFPNADLIHYLGYRFETTERSECIAGFAGQKMIGMPYFMFTGRKPNQSGHKHEF